MNNVLPTLNSSENSQKSLAQNCEMFTTKQIADYLTVDPKTIRTNAKKCLNKVFENGKPTFFSKAEVTKLLDYMQKKNNRSDLTSTTVVQATSTELTPALKIKQAMEMMQEAYEEELTILKAKNVEMQPKAAYVDSFCNSKNLIEIGHLGKVTKIGEQKIFKKLMDDGYIKIRYSTDDIKSYDACYGYEKYFETIHVPFLRGDKQYNRDKLMLNAKGFYYFRAKYASADDLMETADKIIDSGVLNYTIDEVARICNEKVEVIQNFCQLKKYIIDGEPTLYGIHKNIVVADVNNKALFTEIGKDHIVAAMYTINQETNKRRCVE